jgi:predicted phosphoribosyltransferase
MEHTSRYADRRAAGRALGERLRTEQLPDPLVLALPRGGVPVGVEVAAALHAPLDVVVARKIGAPGHSELGVGAITVEGPPVFDVELLNRLGLHADRLAATVEAERTEARRRVAAFRGDRPAPAIHGRSVIVVDDGLATGVTARAAVRSLREDEPGRLVLAVPVGSVQAVESLGEEVEVVCLLTPARFRAVGYHYRDFSQLNDDDVRALLRAARDSPAG